jgi:hypothetical protein
MPRGGCQAGLLALFRCLVKVAEARGIVAGQKTRPKAGAFRV